MTTGGNIDSEGRQDARDGTSKWPRWLFRFVLGAGAVLISASCATDAEQAAEPADDGTAAEADADSASDTDEAAGDDSPTGPVRLIVPGAPGGGLDTAARQIQSALSEALGVDVPVENHEGGNWRIGTREFLDSGSECEAITLTAFPHIFFSYLAGDVDYTYDDFAPIGSNNIQPGLIRVREDAPWESLEDLVEDARARPGEIRASVSGYTSNNYVGLLALENAADIELNIVPYEGQGPESRTALLSGEVDLVHAGVFNTLSIEDGTRVLAVHQNSNEWADLTDNAPTMHEALGTDVLPNQSTYGMFASSECKEQHPERFETLVSAYQEAVQNEDYLANLEDLGELSKLFVTSPDEYDQALKAEEEEVAELIETREELQQ